MINEDGTCGQKCENCPYEHDKKCLDVLLFTLEAKVAIIETREPGDTINRN